MLFCWSLNVFFAVCNPYLKYFLVLYVHRHLCKGKGSCALKLFHNCRSFVAWYGIIFSLDAGNWNTRYFLGFSVYISNTTSKENGVLCFRDTCYTYYTYNTLTLSTSWVFTTEDTLSNATIEFILRILMGILIRPELPYEKWRFTALYI